METAVKIHFHLNSSWTSYYILNRVSYGLKEFMGQNFTQMSQLSYVYSLQGCLFYIGLKRTVCQILSLYPSNSEIWWHAIIMHRSLLLVRCCTYGLYFSPPFIFRMSFNSVSSMSCRRLERVIKNYSDYLTCRQGRKFLIWCVAWDPVSKLKRRATKITNMSTISSNYTST